MKFEDISSPALYEWVKMLVNDSKRQTFYNESPGYKTLAKSTGGTLFAFKRIVGLEPLPHHLELCNEFEVSKLETKEEAWGQV